MSSTSTHASLATKPHDQSLLSSRSHEQSSLYVPYRAIGYITDGVPFVINILGDEQFLIASIGKSFQVRSYPFSSSL